MKKMHRSIATAYALTRVNIEIFRASSVFFNEMYLKLFPVYYIAFKFQHYLFCILST